MQNIYIFFACFLIFIFTYLFTLFNWKLITLQFFKLENLKSFKRDFKRFCYVKIQSQSLWVCPHLMTNHLTYSIIWKIAYHCLETCVHVIVNLGQIYVN